MRPHRNPRRAYDRDGREIEPAGLREMVDRDGIRHVTAYCEEIGCGHSARIDVSAWPEMYVPDIALRLRCSVCGARHRSRIMPDWLEFHAAGRG